MELLKNLFALLIIIFGSLLLGETICVYGNPKKLNYYNCDGEIWYVQHFRGCWNFIPNRRDLSDCYLVSDPQEQITDQRRQKRLNRENFAVIKQLSAKFVEGTHLVDNEIICVISYPKFEATSIELDWGIELEKKDSCGVFVSRYGYIQRTSGEPVMYESLVDSAPEYYDYNNRIYAEIEKWLL